MPFLVAVERQTQLRSAQRKRYDMKGEGHSLEKISISESVRFLFSIRPTLIIRYHIFVLRFFQALFDLSVLTPGLEREN